MEKRKEKRKMRKEGRNLVISEEGRMEGRGKANYKT